MRILVCDDNQEILNEMRELLNEYFSFRHIRDSEIQCFSSGRDLLEDMGKKDIIFLDIEMPGMNGIRAGENIKKDFKDAIIIVVTSYAEYLDEAMRLQVFRFLSKPVEKERLFRNLDDAVEMYNQLSARILIENRKETYTVESRNIIMLEAVGKRVLFYTTSGLIESTQSLDYWEKELPAGSFFRTHRSYIVSMNYIESFNHSIVRFFAQKEEAYVTKRRYKEFKDAYTRYLGGVR
ncbi:MAG: response regulator transcription factor [Lachnospiraceae bacterium]|nr:response regulator transcription factor [Lachnospiraceae bacterium]